MKSGVIVFIGAVLIIAFTSLKNKIDFKKKNKELPDIVYKITQIIYPIQSRKGRIFKAINLERKKRGLRPLVADQFTNILADGRCTEIDVLNEIDHAGVQDEFILLLRKGADSTAEILAYGFATVEGLIRGWMKSPDHREAILNPISNWMGIGVKVDEHNKDINCILFGYEKSINQ